LETRIVNPWTWQDRFGFSQAKEITGAERTLYLAGQTSVDADGQPLHAGDMEAQARQALDNLETVLSEAGYEVSDIARVTIYVTDVDTYRQAAAAAVGRRLVGEGGARYASTLVEVARLALPQLLVEIEATAVR